MRFCSRRFVASAFSAALVVFASQSLAFGQITPRIETTIGSGSSISYFVLDFLSGPTPQSYAFAYRYDGTKTGGDMLDALALGSAGTAKPLTFTFTDYGGELKRFPDGFSYDGKSLTRPSNFSSYWSYWNSTNGVTWTEAQVGLDTRVLTNGAWDGWSYALNGVTVAPRTPLVATAAAPEPGTLTLFAAAAISGAGVIVRRRRKTAGK
ncbi:MAG: PEP-CTERM sorting domain-containing protein [Armatimonadota bacterium]